MLHSILKEDPSDFLDELGQLKDTDLRTFVWKELEKLPKEWWTAPASSSGKYHPGFAARRGGLIAHVKAGVLIAAELCRAFGCEQWEKDAVIAAMILHDAWKLGEHGEKRNCPWEEHSVWIQEHGKVYAESISDQYPEVAKLISTHMGQWGPGDWKASELQMIVHLADYTASRRWLTISAL